MDSNVPTQVSAVGFGLYAIVLEQMEMWDLGNIDPITHYYLYDRTEDPKSRVLIDVTHEVKDAPLISAMREVTVNSSYDISVIEAFISGEATVAQYVPGQTVQGIVAFEIRELPASELAGVREKMRLLVQAHLAHQAAIAAFNGEMGKVRGVLRLAGGSANDAASGEDASGEDTSGGDTSAKHSFSGD